MASSRTNVLVTGGAKRIGRAIVEDLANAGFGVAIHYGTSRREAEALVDQIAAAGGSACAVQADLVDMAMVGELVTRSEALLGPISILVNSASVFEDDSATNFTWEVWDRHFGLHVKAPMLLARSFAQRIAFDAKGLIVNIVDQRVLKSTPRQFSYSLSKSTLWSATQMLAQALGPNVRVNAIGPGPTLPSIRQSQADFDSQVNSLLLKRSPALSEFAATIRYMWETPSMTGQLIALDGGQHLAWQTVDVAGIEE